MKEWIASHKKLCIGIFAGIVVLVGGIFLGVNAYSAHQEKLALEAAYEENQQAAKEVDVLISAIDDLDPEAEDYLDQLLLAVEAAEEAYDALSDEAKEMVTSYDKLTEARSTYETLLEEKESEEQVQKLTDAITAILDLDPESETYMEDLKSAIESARGIYDSLSDEQKEQVANLADLESAEEAYALLEASLESLEESGDSDDDSGNSSGSSDSGSSSGSSSSGSSSSGSSNSGSSSSDSSSSSSSSGSSDSGSSSGSSSSGSSSASAGSSSLSPSEVVSLVNVQRAAAGLSPVTEDATLDALATTRAQECMTSFSHTRPNGSSCFTILSENGVSYTACGENIAAGQQSAAAVMDAWMNSAGHKANILSSSFGKIGVGVVTGGSYGTYWVQLFTN